MSQPLLWRPRSIVLTLLSVLLLLLPTAAVAHPDVTDDPDEEHTLHGDPAGGAVFDHDDALEDHDGDVVSPGPSARKGKVKNLDLVGRGDRLVPDATTDVWVHDKYAYLGTFEEPCGTGEGYAEGEPVDLVQDVEGPGIAIFDVHNPNRPTYIGSIPSVEGSRTNDVKVYTAADGTDILVHSNEACDGGPGGFEIYDVSDPENPVHLAHVQTDDVNPVLRDELGFVDFGVHNLYLFSRDGRDYVVATVESEFGNFQIFDITDPTTPELVGWWGAEELRIAELVEAGELDEAIDPADIEDFDLILELDAYLFDGFGASQNRFLHDFWVSEDGTVAYLANWDAGLVRLDLTDLTDPQVVSVAIDPTSEDGEVNSHSVWPSEDGTIVIEGEEDFAPFRVEVFIGEGLAGIYDSAEAAFGVPIVDLEGQRFEGDTVYVGLACDGGPAVPAGDGDDVAVVQRGDCRFDEKVQNVQDAGGYQAVVIFNNEAGGDAIVTPSGELDDPQLPVIFIGHSAGLELLNVESVDELEIDMEGDTIGAAATADGWSGFRIWDYSDPENPVLASTFNTVCSADPLAPECDPRGVYSSHNVIVETKGNQVLAYASWYSDGVVVIDITDPYNPVEIARYNPMGEEFEEQNAGIQDVWGIYKPENSPFIYASDRNGGLYVLQLRGAGSGKDNPGKDNRP